MKSQESTAIPMNFKLLLAPLCLIGIGIILLATYHYGAGISPDSVGYVATARNIAHGTGVVSYDNIPLVVQPPLYPAILGAIDFVLGIDPLFSANIVNAFLFGLTLYLSGLLFFKHLSSTIFALLGTVFLLVSIPLIEVSLMAWSELLFIFFIVLYLVFSQSYAEKRNIKSLLLLSLSVALACLTRYVGVIFILTGIVYILLIQRDRLKTKSLHWLIFIFVSGTPICIWVTRNYFISGTPFGPRAPAIYSIFENLSFTFVTIYHWYVPGKFSPGFSMILIISAIIIFSASIIFAYTKVSPLKLVKSARPFSVLIFLVMICYLGFLVISASITAYDMIDDRLMSPIVVPLTLFWLSVIKMLSRSLKARCRTIPVDLLIMAGLVMWPVYPFSKTVLNISNHMNKGSGFTAVSWRNSQTIQYVTENPSNCSVYSNGNDVIYLLANKNVKLIPLKGGQANVIAELASLKKTWPQENDACIVWFNQISFRTFIFSPDELLSITNLEQSINLNDGTIYFVSRK